jgi:hypothetical protein
MATTTTTAKLIWSCDTTNVLGYRLYKSSDAVHWYLLFDETTLKVLNIEVSLANKTEYYRVSSILNNGFNSESNWSNAMGIANFSTGKKYLVVDGFERENDGSWRGSGHIFATRYGASIAKNAARFESVKNSQLINGTVTLNGYDGVFWFLGDEGSEMETFSDIEQAIVKQYLENGGRLFVSGGQIGWDIFVLGSTDDKSFYNNYLKASFNSISAGAIWVNAVSGTPLDGCNFMINQTYDEEYVDQIDTSKGSTLCMSYSNNKGAGVHYAGPFGASEINGKLVYLSFALETTANDSAFDKIIANALLFFTSEPNGIPKTETAPSEFSLKQNYPNPFNPTTIIKYTVSHVGTQHAVSLRVYDLLGREVATLVNEKKPAGSYQVKWNAGGLPSGVYFYRLTVGTITETKRLVLLK